MKKIIFLIATILLIAGCTSAGTKNKNLSTSCQEHKGTWIEVSQECEYPDSREWCEEAGGEFKECESACRNNPDAEICTMQCVIVCQF